MWWELKGHLEVKNGELFIAGYSAIDLARRFGTPLYVYNGKRIIENYRRFYSAISKECDKEIRIHYSMKANSNPHILEILKKEGAWIDAVSPEEVELAIKLGFKEEEILFTGSSVSYEDLKSIANFKLRINIDSLSCLYKLKKLGVDKELSLRIDPGIKGLGHGWRVITAGKEAHGVPIKFSLTQEDFFKALDLIKKFGFKLKGLHEHVGSGWISKEEVDEFIETVKVLLKRAEEAEEFLDKSLEFLDLGGGPGVRYKEDQNDFPLEYYSKRISELILNSKVNFEALAFEPGRYIVADSGILLVEVSDVKFRYGEVIVGVNSGFNHLIRPVLYGSYHEIINCNNPNAEKEAKVTIVGNLCETGDVFAVRRRMAMPKEGDILAIHNAGAYGYSMASRYNLRSLPKELLILDGRVIISEENVLRKSYEVNL